jgi:hypothetical protein
MGNKPKEVEGPVISTAPRQISISHVVNELMNADLRTELALEAIIQLLNIKKLPDGTPLFAEKEIENKIIELRDKYIENMKIARVPSGLIVPGSSGLPS